MSDKDVNIHVKARDVDQTKKQIDDVGDSVENLGKKTSESQSNTGTSVEKTTEKFSIQGKILNNLKSYATGAIVSMLGLQAIQHIADNLIARFERISAAMRDIYDRSLSLSEVGQRLEFQTGTKGQQRQWAIAAANLQKTGGLSDIQTAQQMMISADIAFGAQGGIKNKEIMNMLGDLAPFVGTAQLGPEEITKLFEFAGAAGIQPNAKAYKDYFAKLQAGFTASKATSFGQFMTGLQKGATGYMAMGGSLDEAIAAFSSARAVTANEALAASLLEQVTRLSGGGYEKPRQDIERKMHVKWKDLTMDQRLSTLLDYVGKIPESQRTQKLSEAGFPVELSGQLGKIVSDEAKQTMQRTRDSVKASSSKNIDEMTQAYLGSDIGKAKQTEGIISAQTIKGSEKISSWEDRLKLAKSLANIAISQNKDSKIVRDSIEGVDIAYKMMLEEAEEIENKVKGTPLEYRTHELVRSLREARLALRTPIINRLMGGKLETEGYIYEKELSNLKSISTSSSDLSLPENFSPSVTNQLPFLSQPWQQPFAPAEPKQGPVNITHNNDNSINFYPSIGSTEYQRMDFNE
jgi:hypothetical protein